jgi:hypothetical protein
MKIYIDQEHELGFCECEIDVAFGTFMKMNVRIRILFCETRRKIFCVHEKLGETILIYGLCYENVLFIQLK